MYVELSEMRDGAIFLVFFVFFTLATLAVPIPMFPGSMMRSVYDALSIPVSLYTPLLDALANGAVYGFIIWIMFVLISRRLEEPDVKIKPREGKRHSRERSMSQG